MDTHAKIELARMILMANYLHQERADHRSRIAAEVTDDQSLQLLIAGLVGTNEDVLKWARRTLALPPVAVPPRMLHAEPIA
jgi:hypothetical protein